LKRSDNILNFNIKLLLNQACGIPTFRLRNTQKFKVGETTFSFFLFSLKESDICGIGLEGIRGF